MSKKTKNKKINSPLGGSAEANAEARGVNQHQASNPEPSWTIISRNDHTTLPPASGRYNVIYRQEVPRDGEFLGRYIEDYNAEDKQWLTGMRSVEILAWCPVPEIPEEIIKKYT